MPWWLMPVLVFGVNFALWGTVGLCRLLDTGAARLARWRFARRFSVIREVAYTGAAYPGAWPGPGGGRSPGATGRPGRRGLTVADVAVLIPAHNEAEVIAESLAAITELIPMWNVHVVSDGSTDTTVAIARSAGAKVYQTEHNMGKAGALQDAIARFRLVERFAVVMLLDADTRVEPGYFSAALPLFDDPEVVAVAGCVRTAADRALSLAGQLLVGHRRRIYSIGQRVLKFGQTWRRFNATHIVPGFASLYRTSVLPHIDMNPPGLVIEDFNMTFEVYQKGLGKVAFSLSAVAVTQDPDNFRDYIKQTRRWALGFWQTVRRHRLRANLFSAMLLLLELVTSSLIFVILPALLLILVIPELYPAAAAWPGFGTVYALTAAHIEAVGHLLRRGAARSGHHTHRHPAGTEAVHAAVRRFLPCHAGPGRRPRAVRDPARVLVKIERPLEEPGPPAEPGPAGTARPAATGAGGDPAAADNRGGHFRR